jgi:hypothetical protein
MVIGELLRREHEDFQRGLERLMKTPLRRYNRGSK